MAGASDVGTRVRGRVSRSAAAIGKAAAMLAMAGIFIEFLPVDMAFLLATIIILGLVLASDDIRFRVSSAYSVIRKKTARWLQAR